PPRPTRFRDCAETSEATFGSVRIRTGLASHEFCACRQQRFYEDAELSWSDGGGAHPAANVARSYFINFTSSRCCWQFETSARACSGGLYPVSAKKPDATIGGDRCVLRTDPSELTELVISAQDFAVALAGPVGWHFGSSDSRSSGRSSPHRGRA